LETRFNEEDEDTDKVGWSFEELEAPPLDPGTDQEGNDTTFTPSAAQWNALVHRVENLTSKLEYARTAVTALVEVSEGRFEVVDGQVINLRGSIGQRPSENGSNLSALDLWTNDTKLADEVTDNRESLFRSKLSPYEKVTRTFVDGCKATAKKQASALAIITSVKAEYKGQVKPLEAMLQDMTMDLYSPEGSYNKALMSGLKTGSGESPQLKAQMDLMTNQIQELTGSSQAEKDGSMNDATLTSLKADVARLLVDNQTIKAKVLGEKLFELIMKPFILRRRLNGGLSTVWEPILGLMSFSSMLLRCLSPYRIRVEPQTKH
jgi:hypothetical protein